MCTPVLVMKVSAIFVLTVGMRSWFAFLVGYLWIDLFLTNRLLKMDGRSDLLYLNMKMPAFRV
jgi:hypothetical protein